MCCPYNNQCNFNGQIQAAPVSEMELNRIYQDFRTFTGNSDRLYRNQFAEFYKSLSGAYAYDQQTLKQEINRVFATFDTDRSGYLSFGEFMNAVTVLNRSIPKQNRCNGFVCNRTRGNCMPGADMLVTPEHAKYVFQDMNNFYGASGLSPDEHWRQVDPENRGSITQSELLDYVSNRAGFDMSA